jgi:aspartyl protease family protein
MLKNAIAFAVISVLVAIFAPQLLSSDPKPAPAPAPRAALVAPASAPAPPPPSPAPTEGFRETSLAADSRGQYSADVLIDGERVHMLIDTGATMVSISASVAARLGVTADPGKPRWRIQTANGESVATAAMLPSISLGGLYMTDVEALVLDSSAGEVNLLGASFLKRLASVEQRNGELILRQ